MGAKRWKGTVFISLATRTTECRAHMSSTCRNRHRSGREKSRQPLLCVISVSCISNLCVTYLVDVPFSLPP